MLPNDILTGDENELDAHLGYPRGYAKLCRHAHIQMQGLITPFTEGPPQRFLPYAPLDEEISKIKEFDTLFPIIDESERDPSSTRRYAGHLWQQLDHLGNAGFDPAKFRVDCYGNVLYWSADPGSPLAWEVDHWFPHSRGGKTVLTNLRIIQWQVNQRKSTKLEFLVPWWDLQLGISVNQFLSVFASKNMEFRQRAFSLLFTNGESEQLDGSLVVESHSWPQPFRERKHQIGLAAAAIVRVQKQMDDTLKVLNTNKALIKQSNAQAGVGATPGRKRWTPDEEDALKRALQIHGPGNWKEIKECEPLLANRSTVQIKDKYRLVKGEWGKENRDEPAGDRQIVLFQREEQLRQAQSVERQKREEQQCQLEEELRQLKDDNEEEKRVLEDLEKSLAKQRKRVEKQRKWSEKQSQYRQCLEKMIRDTVHQSVLFKEQARLNQAACNALLARLESQKSACDSAEMDMLKGVKQRESLEALARPKITKRFRNEGHADVGGCMRLAQATGVDTKHEGWHRTVRPSKKDACNDTSRTTRHTPSSCQEQNSPSTDCSGARLIDCDPSIQDDECSNENADMCSEVVARVQEREDDPVDSGADAIEVHASKAATVDGSPDSRDLRREDEEVPDSQSLEDVKNAASPHFLYESSGMKRKATEESDVDVHLQKYEVGHPEDVKDDNDGRDVSTNTGDDAHPFMTRENQQLDELLQEVMVMKGKVTAAMEDAIRDEDDEEHVKRVGKFNVDKWLHVLLHPGTDDATAGTTIEEQSNAQGCSPETQETLSQGEADETGEGGMLSDLIKRMSLKTQQAAGADWPDVACEPDQEATQKNDVLAKEPAQQRVDSSVRRHASPSQGRPLVALSCPKQPPGSTCGIRKIQHKAMPDRHGRQNSKLEERRAIESFSRLKLVGSETPDANVAAGSSAENSEVAFQIACETEFVEKMRAAREREQRRRLLVSAGIRPQLQELMADSTSTEPSQEQDVQIPRSHSPTAPPATSSLSDAKVKRHDAAELRRFSTGGVGGPRPQHQQLVVARHRQQHQLTLGAEQQCKQIVQHTKPQHTSLQSNPRHNSARTMERSTSTPAGGQNRHVHAPPSPAHYSAAKPAKDRVTAGEEEPQSVKQRQASASRAPQLARQLTVGGGGGGAARKASMLMKSASTRASSSSGGSPARSKSSSGGGGSGGGRGRAGEGEPEVASIRRKPSFFQDWDVNENLRASLSQVWKKAVKKFDLARQQPQSQPRP